jgi:hypothetical protein
MGLSNPERIRRDIRGNCGMGGEAPASCEGGERGAGVFPSPHRESRGEYAYPVHQQAIPASQPAPCFRFDGSEIQSRSG